MLKDVVSVLQRMSTSLSTHDDTVEFESLDLQTKLSEVESWSKKRLSAWIGNHGHGTSKSGNRSAGVNRVKHILQHGPSRYCCVPYCRNRSNDELPDGTRVTLHRIPADKATRKLWLSRLHNVRKNLTVNSDTRVCIVHFKDHELGNLPTIFPSKPEKVSCARRQVIKSVADPPSIDALPCHMPELGNISGYDMSSSDFCPTCGHSDTTGPALYTPG